MILNTAKEVLNENPPRTRSPWFDEDCAEAICAKNEAKRIHFIPREKSANMSALKVYTGVHANIVFPYNASMSVIKVYTIVHIAVVFT